MKIFKVLLPVVLGLFISTSIASAHCQIPCGIYADDVVFGELATDVDTIEKAMNEIQRLGKDVSENPQQLVRWVTNKESHAQNIQDVMSAYFLAQRINLDLKDSEPDRYAKLVSLAHEITVVAMKCKQTTDLNNARQLRDALHNFQHLYTK